ncbi:hypothetical protein DM46_1239 [Burkholderia mallei]|nr:hypothetical protein DM46_1239 [Burkholderia mallei]KOT21356.1 hypothetical protein DM52_1250 [Burkholderia mallei]
MRACGASRSKPACSKHTRVPPGAGSSRHVIVVSSVRCANAIANRRSGSTAITSHGCRPHGPMSSVKRWPGTGRTSPAAHQRASAAGVVSAAQTCAGGRATNCSRRIGSASVVASDSKKRVAECA